MTDWSQYIDMFEPSAGNKLLAFVRDVRQQIHVAEDAGAEHDDLCIAFPPGFMAMAAGWPTVRIEGAEVHVGDALAGTLDFTVALVPKLWARDRCDEALGEMAYRPPDLPDHGGGLWGFTESPTSLADLKDFAAAEHGDWTDPNLQTRFMLDDER